MTLLAEYTAEGGPLAASILPQVFSHLDAADGPSRRNALRLLEYISSWKSDVFVDLPHLRTTLSTKLLPKLHHDDIQERVAGSNLFAVLGECLLWFANTPHFSSLFSRL